VHYNVNVKVKTKKQHIYQKNIKIIHTKTTENICIQNSRNNQTSNKKRRVSLDKQTSNKKRRVSLDSSTADLKLKNSPKIFK